jgi:hypothetical protein
LLDKIKSIDHRLNFITCHPNRTNKYDKIELSKLK